MGDGGASASEANAHTTASSDVAMMTFATCQSRLKVCSEVSGEVFTPKRKRSFLRQAGAPINKRTPGWVVGGG